jgi:hypothetical protein
MKRMFRLFAVLVAAAFVYGCGGGTADTEKPKFDEERPGPGVSVGAGYGGGKEIAGILSLIMAKGVLYAAGINH